MRWNCRLIPIQMPRAATTGIRLYDFYWQVSLRYTFLKSFTAGECMHSQLHSISIRNRLYTVLNVPYSNDFSVASHSVTNIGWTTAPCLTARPTGGSVESIPIQYPYIAFFLARAQQQQP